MNDKDRFGFRDLVIDRPRYPINDFPPAAGCLKRFSGTVIPMMNRQAGISFLRTVEKLQAHPLFIPSLIRLALLATGIENKHRRKVVRQNILVIKSGISIIVLTNPNRS